ncbi:Acetoin catabolism regulatory protein [Massilia sp. Bi118]|uniref:sigma-54-dependent Fis family transcriptional regulator n=1 Tax=Massilia sp. Bi118 TaxID=2822346 RepID=UPI001DD5A3CB|nr:sigma-54-dependent Fis family transcriptional regulator [Massilia sp. Bi118]CAH0318732.1 Acetoin catabolism regulatory protein [Massilia sp. Bi118]
MTYHLPATIASSHRRSLHYGLRANLRPDFDPLSGSALSALVEQNRMLYSHAVPAMETLYQQIANTHNSVLLTDARGVILHSLGDADFLEKANRVALTPGVDWSEESKGTNAIGTAIAERAPTTVHADQHYLTANHFLTCSAAPIVDHHGDVIGVLDVSGDRRSFHKHTMALVRMSALMIENQLFAAAFGNAITLHFHTRPEFIGTLMEGIASFTPGGRFLAANRNCLFQLGLSTPALQAHTFSSLFGLPLSALYDHYRSAAPGLLDLCMHNGVRVRGRAELRLAHGVQLLNDAPSLPAPPAAPRPVTPPPRSRLQALDTGDARLAQAVAKVGKVLGQGVTILVMGETGTGKEMLAQAIHADSPRARGPFVAVNCAAIPEALIESELFGYEEGAFTGARRKGASGRIMQAHGGTLFLDEIGDMPLALQARLLRVLEERKVVPLGGARALAVDIEVVCATNHDLRKRIADGLFREDLYYRLNGLVVKLPPLRERSDLDAIVNQLLVSEARTRRVADEVLQLFRRHAWPGNLRQLASLLRTASLMAGDEGEIGLQHLPDDFLDDLDAAPAAPPPAQRAATTARLDDLELGAILRSLDAHGGNVSAAARALGVSRNTIYRKLPRA